MRPEISTAFLTKTPWEFATSTGKIFSKSFSLSPDGRIAGYEHPNERSWLFKDGKISLRNGDGKITTTLGLDNSKVDIEFSGRVLNADSNIHHILRRPKPTIGCFLRTHFWDQYVAQALELLRASWVGPLYLCADQTRPFFIPEGVPHIDHYLKEFLLYGLSTFPDEARALWYNGDYVFYNLAVKTDFDYFVICEFDLLVKEDLGALVLRMIYDGCDYVAPNIRQSNADWIWGQVQKEWIKFEAVKSRLEETDPQILGAFFPFTFISRQAATRLFSRRVECAWLARNEVKPAWPFCEAFVPTELNRLGFVSRSLEKYVTGRMSLTVNDAVCWPDAMKTQFTMLHPVLGGERFVDKLCKHPKFQELPSADAKVEWLSNQKSNCSGELEKDLLERRIKSIR